MHNSKKREGSCIGNGLDLYLGGAWFGSQVNGYPDGGFSSFSSISSGE